MAKRGTYSGASSLVPRAWMGVAGRNGYRTTATEKQALIERNNELWEKGEIGKKKAPKRKKTLLRRTWPVRRIEG